MFGRRRGGRRPRGVPRGTGDAAPSATAVRPAVLGPADEGADGVGADDVGADDVGPEEAPVEREDEPSAGTSAPPDDAPGPDGPAASLLGAPEAEPERTPERASDLPSAGGPGADAPEQVTGEAAVDEDERADPALDDDPEHLHWALVTTAFVATAVAVAALLLAAGHVI